MAQKFLCPSCDSYTTALQEAVENGEQCPHCGAEVRSKDLSEGGGVECSKGCGWWFCY